MVNNVYTSTLTANQGRSPGESALCTSTVMHVPVSEAWREHSMIYTSQLQQLVDIGGSFCPDQFYSGSYVFILSPATSRL